MHTVSESKDRNQQDGLRLAALGDNDLKHALEMISDCEPVRFDCGHAIHIEKPKYFLSALLAEII